MSFKPIWCLQGPAVSPNGLVSVTRSRWIYWFPWGAAAAWHCCRGPRPGSAGVGTWTVAAVHWWASWGYCSKCAGYLAWRAAGACRRAAGRSHSYGSNVSASSGCDKSYGRSNASPAVPSPWQWRWPLPWRWPRRSEARRTDPARWRPAPARGRCSGAPCVWRASHRGAVSRIWSWACCWRARATWWPSASWWCASGPPLPGSSWCHAAQRIRWGWPWSRRSPACCAALSPAQRYSTPSALHSWASWRLWGACSGPRSALRPRCRLSAHTQTERNVAHFASKATQVETARIYFQRTSKHAELTAKGNVRQRNHRRLLKNSLGLSLKSEFQIIKPGKVRSDPSHQLKDDFIRTGILTPEDKWLRHSNLNSLLSMLWLANIMFGWRRSGCIHLSPSLMLTQRALLSPRCSCWSGCASLA